MDKNIINCIIFGTACIALTLFLIGIIFSFLYTKKKNEKFKKISFTLIITSIIILFIVTMLVYSDFAQIEETITYGECHDF